MPVKGGKDFSQGPSGLSVSMSLVFNGSWNHKLTDLMDRMRYLVPQLMEYREQPFLLDDMQPKDKPVIKCRRR
jgi:hypothetical protein